MNYLNRLGQFGGQADYLRIMENLKRDAMIQGQLNSYPSPVTPPSIERPAEPKPSKLLLLMED